MWSAGLVGALLVLAAATKYAALAMAPFVLAMTFLATLPGPQWRREFWRGVLRYAFAAIVFAGLLLLCYRLWGSASLWGVRATTTGREAPDPAPLSVLLKSLL